MPTSVRLDAKTERLVARLAREKGQTKSQVIRDALHSAAEKTNRRKFSRPYDRIAHLIGSVSGGPADLSERTGEKFRKLLIERQRTKR